MFARRTLRSNGKAIVCFAFPLWSSKESRGTSVPQRMDLLRWGNLRLVQEDQAFCLSLDGVLLADFVTIKNNDNVGDLGTGNGALPLLLSCRASQAQFTGLELLPEMAALAQRNIAANGLTLSLIHISEPTRH